MILDFVVTVLAQCFPLDFWPTKVNYLLHYIAGMCQTMFLTNVSNSSIHLIPPLNLALLFNRFNKTSPEQNVDLENVVNSRYFDIDEKQALKLHDKKSPSFSHINARSLEKLWWSGVSTKMHKQIVWYNCSKWNQNFQEKFLNL